VVAVGLFVDHYYGNTIDASRSFLPSNDCSCVDFGYEPDWLVSQRNPVLELEHDRAVAFAGSVPTRSGHLEFRLEHYYHFLLWIRPTTIELWFVP
jgi:hypothetical protein